MMVLWICPLLQDNFFEFFLLILSKCCQICLVVSDGFCIFAF